MNDFEQMLPDAIYDMAEEVKLSELLASPTTRHWTISALSNICNIELIDVKNIDPQDRQMLFLVTTVNNAIPNRIRQDDFQLCTEKVRASRASRKIGDKDD